MDVVAVGANKPTLNLTTGARPSFS